VRLGIWFAKWFGTALTANHWVMPSTKLGRVSSMFIYFDCLLELWDGVRTKSGIIKFGVQQFKSFSAAPSNV
jgi:hypothetical protein